MANQSDIRGAREMKLDYNIMDIANRNALLVEEEQRQEELYQKRLDRWDYELKWTLIGLGLIFFSIAILPIFVEMLLSLI